MSKFHSASPALLGLIEDIEIGKIKQSLPSYRFIHTEIDELVRSINKKGLLQPIIVRSKGEYYEIVAGNRRYKACTALGWRKIVCHIAELDDKEAFEVSLIENIQRKNLEPIEQAHAFKNYVLAFGWGGISELSAKIGKSVSYIDKIIRLLDLPADILDSISKFEINRSTAEELLSIRDNHRQSKLAKIIRERRLSSRQVRELVKDHKEGSIYDFDEKWTFREKFVDIDRNTQKSFDKSIVALRVAMNTLSTIMEYIEDNWIVYETLMQHKNMLHTQIDLLIKEKRKL
ncbi:MAG TPA: ParB/RepB/Spo0J family partition protein [Nitrososphaeraceae archaeon]|nr:ParB/RepB/Spo0J family partition protein [Nitrososphaeraceae archaeon]